MVKMRQREPFKLIYAPPVAVFLSMEDEDELERLILAYSPKFQGILQKAKKEIQERGGIAHKDFWQDI
jgi:hypothetical protein